MNTSDLGENRRYSFLKTPLEMQSPDQNIQFPQRAAVSSPQPTPQQDTATYHHPSLDEKSQHAGPYQDPIEYPNFEQHPANYAPFADSPSQWSPPPKAMTYHSHTVSSNPPDLQPEQNRPASVAQERPYALPIAPDANPLQSPQSPYFPPPTTVAPQTPATLEMRSYHQPGQIQHPNQRVKGGAWSHGLGDCSNIWTCCLGFTCPCILYGKTQYRLSMLSRKEDPTNMLGYETCNGSCTAMGLLCGCQWLLATIQHTRVRKAYGIRGSIASDCVRASCCTCCTLVQDEAEIQKREEERARAIRESGVGMLSPYTAPAPMSYGQAQK